MYAIRSKKTNRWFHGINAQAGAGSSLRIQMDDVLPALFRTKEMARVEPVSYTHLDVYKRQFHRNSSCCFRMNAHR